MSIEPNKIKVVSFDLDNTLYDNVPVIERAYNKLYDLLRTNYENLNRLTLEQFMQTAHEVIEQHPELHYDVSRLRQLHIESLFQSHDVQTGDPAQAFEAFLNARQDIELYPGVITLLSELKPHYPLVSLTNGNADPERFGLAGIFEARFTASDAGALKPHPECFDQVTRSMHIQPGQLLHIGDGVNNDFLGALNFGAQAIWYNPKNEPLPDSAIGLGGFETISELSQIRELLLGN